MGSLIGDGGEAQVFNVVGHPSLVAKIYKNPTHERQVKLAWMVDHAPVSSSSPLPSLAWPSSMVFRDSGILAGFLMPRIDGAVTIFQVQNPAQRQKVLPAWIGDLEWARLIRVARNLASVVSVVHRAGYVIGDINEGNILVTPDGLVTIIDTDSFQVRVVENGQSTTLRSTVGREPYTPPELQGSRFGEIDRTEFHDRFGLGVIIFQLLMEGNHPFRAEWTGAGDPPAPGMRIKMGAYPHQVRPTAPVRPSPLMPAITILPPQLVVLFHRCFVLGHSDPSQRPSASDWETALIQVERELRRCTNGHVYGQHLPNCPWCVRDTRMAAARQIHQRAASGSFGNRSNSMVPSMGGTTQQYRNLLSDVRRFAIPIIGLILFAVIGIGILDNVFGSEEVSLEVSQSGLRQVKLVWKSSVDADAYRIYVDPPFEPPYRHMTRFLSDGRYTLSNVRPGHNCFWIVTESRTADTVRSNVACLTVD